MINGHRKFYRLSDRERASVKLGAKSETQPTSPWSMSRKFIAACLIISVHIIELIVTDFDKMARYGGLTWWTRRRVVRLFSFDWLNENRMVLAAFAGAHSLPTLSGQSELISTQNKERNWSCINHLECNQLEKHTSSHGVHIVPDYVDEI